MHKRRLNELKLHFVIEPAGPLLIKSGDDTAVDPTLPEMTFVRTRHPQYGDNTIYLPGSSLKGVIRSHSERIIRTVLGDDATICCDPLDNRHNCQERIKSKKLKDSDAQYKELCLACRIFGHMDHASHFLAADAYPPQPINNLPLRHNVAIDRLSGGVAAGPFDMEVALAGEFHTRLTLVNFELWQVGLIALALRDIAEGRVRLGFAKSRGLGEVKLYLTQLEVGYPGQVGSGYSFDQKLYGVGGLVRTPQGAADDKFIAAYGFVHGGDEAAYGVHGLYDSGSLWARPCIQFGAEQPTAVSGAALAQVNDQVMAALAPTVAAWVQFARQHQAGGR